MNHKCSTSTRCALCAVTLPRGVRVALFSTPESDEAVLGDFCSVGHALAALEQFAESTGVPETLFLGVRVDREDHDDDALAAVMADVVRRAVHNSVAGEEAMERDVDAPRLSQLN